MLKLQNLTNFFKAIEKFILTEFKSKKEHKTRDYKKKIRIKILIIPKFIFSILINTKKSVNDVGFIVGIIIVVKLFMSHFIVLGELIQKDSLFYTIEEEAIFCYIYSSESPSYIQI